ncbi:dienelactone hydrolase family protein [Novosphingobium sp. AAP83]|uniref:dienelactone hydrolase family protein n=1 Tax=Novosphingobium sp. AAP83 TaxID=1523425 RepID=UPI0006B9EA57|nr:dienelactone hydrolase family protein [Novosphingobium sp. AAP83]
MIEAEIDITTAAGLMNTFVVKPPSDIPLPLVILLMDASGVREELRDIARRIAATGYVVALPNLYYRQLRTYDSGPLHDHPEAQDNMRRMLELLGTIDKSATLDDIGALLTTAPDVLGCATGPAGLVGYCFSGSLATLGAATYGDAIGFFASFFGTSLVTDAANSPHQLLSSISAEGYFEFGSRDMFIPQATIEALSLAVPKSGLCARIVTVPNAEHGYVFADRDAYLPPAREEHLGTIIDLCRRTLGSKSGA